MKSKQIIIMLLSFIILFAMSCKNDDKMGSGDGNSFNLDSIPTTSGDVAIYFTGNYTFSYTLARQSLGGISKEEANSGTLPASIEITVTINANKITVNSELSLISSVQLNNGTGALSFLIMTLEAIVKPKIHIIKNL